MRDPQLTENDRAELAKFKLYLEAVGRWDNANDFLPDWSTRAKELVVMEWQRKRLKAHAAIYEQIYGEKP